MPNDHAPGVIELAREPQFVLAGLRVHPATREVVGDGGREVLEPRVMQVLVALARAAGDVISRNDLNALCWGRQVVGDDALSRCIARLRRLSDTFGGFAIETVPRVGYRLDGMQAAPASSRRGAKPSIAVLPFANLSDQPGLDYFVDGMVEEISTALTRVRSLFVVAGGSGLSLKGQGLTAQEAGARLGVRYLLDGSVRRADDRVRISVNLIDAHDGVQIWADRFDGGMTDIFDLQEDVALRAAARIEPRVYREEVRRALAKPPTGVDSYEFFLRAGALIRSASRVDMRQSLPLFERSLELDPSNARVLVTSANALAFVQFFDGSDDRDGLRALAYERLQAAVRLAADDASVLAAAAMTLHDLNLDLATARSLADRAIAVNPGHAGGWRASGWLRWPTDPETATKHLEYCLRLDPLSPLGAATLTALGFARVAQRRIDEAVGFFRQSAELWPEYPTNHVILAACHAHLGELAEARAAAARFHATSGRDVWAHAELIGPWPWLSSRLARIDLEG